MRKTALVAGSVALAVALTACHNADHDQASPSSQTNPPGSESSAPPVDSMETVVKTAQESIDQAETATFSTEIDPRDDPVAFTGEGRFTSEDPALDMTFEMEDYQEEMRLLDTSLYHLVSADPAVWAELLLEDDNDEPQQAGVRFGQMMDTINVHTLLEHMKFAGTTKEREEAELDGDPATCFSLDFDIQEIVEKQGGFLWTLEDELEQSLETVQAALCLNDQDLPRQITISSLRSPELPPEALATTSAHAMAMLSYTDWERSVDIDPPPADQIVDAADIISE